MKKIYKVDFFDGQSSKKLPLSFEVYRKSIIFIENGWQFSIKEISLSSKIEGVSQTLVLPNGGYCILKASDTLSLKKSIVPFLESKVKYTIFSVILMVAIVAFALSYGSAWSAKMVANLLPRDALSSLSQKSLLFLKESYLEPSKLPLQTKEYLRKTCNQIAPKGLHVKLHFYRSSLLKANAFALPSGDIVLLDDLVYLDKDKDLLGIIGVLAHEIGHVKRRHTLQSIVRGSIVGVLVAYFIGDYSTIITTLSAGLITFSYSREFEKEADDEAIGIMKKNNYSLKPLVLLFEEISKQNRVRQQEIFSTHPLFKKRIEKIKHHIK